MFSLVASPSSAIAEVFVNGSLGKVPSAFLTYAVP